MLLRYFLSHVALFLSFTGITQTLTISSAANSGAYNYSAGTLTVSATSNIQASQIQTWLALGDLTIVGSTSALSVDVNQAITSTTVGRDLVIGLEANTGTISIDANLTVAGSITLSGGTVQFGATITSTQTGAAIQFLSKGQILNTAATTINTQGGAILFAADTDNNAIGNIYIPFTFSLESNGGNITLAGGDFTGSGYARGSGASFEEGIDIRGATTINSDGGNIILRGKSDTGVATGDGIFGVGFWGAGTNKTINAGSGTIFIEGVSYGTDTTNDYNYGVTFDGATVSIISSNTSSNAIVINGSNASGDGTVDGRGIDLRATNTKIYATETGGGIRLEGGAYYGFTIYGTTEVLAKSGPIQFINSIDGVEKDIYINGSLWLGSKASTAVTTSSSNILIQADDFSFANGSTPSIATTGLFTFEPGSMSGSFDDALTTSLFLWNQNSQTISGLTLGKLGNSTDVTLGAVHSVAGPVSIYGGDIAVNQNVTSTLSGADVLLQATGAISLAANKVIQTANGDITFKATANGVGTTASSAIYLYAGSDLISNGGNIILGGGYSGTQGNLYAATAISGGGYALRLNFGVVINASGGNIAMYGRNVTSYGDGVYMDGVSITTTGTGTIGIYGDSFGGYTASPVTYFGGITFDNSAATIQTNEGNITLEGVLTNSQSTQGYAINFYRNSGSPGQTQHIQILSQTGNIQITANRGTSIGNGIGHSSWGHIYFGSPADNSFTASGNVKLSYSGFVGAVNNGFKVKTTGVVTYEPAGASFDDPQTFPLNSNHVLADGASSLTIGKAGNTAGIIIGSNQSVGGDINIYAGTITLSGNLTATNGGDISLYSNSALAGLTSARTVNAAGTFTYAPQGTSFAAAVNYPITNLSVSSKGLTIGKVGNDKNITIGAATSIDGPITLHGASIALSNALTSSNATTGDISLNGTTLTGSSTITLPTGRTLTMNLSSNTTYAGSIVGTGLNLVKDGAGILALTASNTPTFANVTISGGTYRLNTNQQLTLSGVLTNNGTFTMRDGATLVQATSGTSITGSGTYNVQKFVSGNSATWNTTSSGRYWYMGVPMSSTTRNDFGAYNINSNRVWSYSEATKQYTHLTDNNAALNAGTGYVHRRATNDTLTFTATGANGLYGADFSLTNLTRTSGVYSGYHLIANPYMAYLDWNAINKTNIEPTYYIRSNNAGVDISALISYNAGTNLHTNTSSVTTTAGQLQYLAPLQSIWIRVGAAAATGDLTMDRSMLSHQSGNPGLKNSTIFPTLARVNLQDGARFDQLLVYMNPDMTNGVDQYDSEKMFVSGASQIYTMAAGKKLVMNGLKNNKSKISVPLYLELPESKVYQLSLAEYILEDGIILLEDKQEGTIQDFTIHDVYSFYATSGVLSNRFVLHFFTPDNGITAQGPSNSWVEEEAVINEGGNILVNSDRRGKVTIQQDIDPSPSAKGNVVVRDAAGREVWKGQLNGSATTLELDTPSGIYFVEVELNGQVEMKKIFVQQ